MEKETWFKIFIGLVVGLFVMALFVVPVYKFIKYSRQSSSVSIEQAGVYKNDLLKVSLNYPEEWTGFSGVDGRHGEDGFFAVNLFGNEQDSLEKVAFELAYDSALTYGASPAVTSMQVDFQNAYLISPDPKDQEKKNSVLVVAYPSPIVVNNINYQFFVLYADKAHMESLMKSLKFVF